MSGYLLTISCMRSDRKL